MDASVILSECLFKAVRSGGKGGQHVNKVSSRVELHFNPSESKGLTDSEKERLLVRLASKLSSEGVLRIVDDTSRSQYRNRILAGEKLISLLQESLKEKKKRKKTRIPAAANRKRLEDKAKRKQLKGNRKKPDW